MGVSEKAVQPIIPGTKHKLDYVMYVMQRSEDVYIST